MHKQAHFTRSAFTLAISSPIPQIRVVTTIGGGWPAFTATSSDRHARPRGLAPRGAGARLGRMVAPPHDGQIRDANRRDSTSMSLAAFDDDETARRTGEAFGRGIGRHTAAKMTQADLTRADLRAIGEAGVATILARADVLAESGSDPARVATWTDGAADAFHAELDRAAALLSATDPSGRRH